MATTTTSEPQQSTTTDSPPTTTNKLNTGKTEGVIQPTTTTTEDQPLDQNTTTISISVRGQGSTTNKLQTISTKAVNTTFSTQNLPDITIMTSYVTIQSHTQSDAAATSAHQPQSTYTRMHDTSSHIQRVHHQTPTIGQSTSTSTGLPIATPSQTPATKHPTVEVCDACMSTNTPERSQSIHSTKTKAVATTRHPTSSRAASFKYTSIEHSAITTPYTSIITRQGTLALNTSQQSSTGLRQSEMVAWILVALLSIAFTALLIVNSVLLRIFWKRKITQHIEDREPNQIELKHNPCYANARGMHQNEEDIYSNYELI